MTGGIWCTPTVFAPPSWKVSSYISTRRGGPPGSPQFDKYVLWIYLPWVVDEELHSVPISVEGKERAPGTPVTVIPHHDQP